MIQNPLVSFCMSTYKRPSILKVQLNQILKQEYKNFEIVVSDNDEELSGKSVVDEIGDERIKYFSNSVNLGMVKSFNKSVERSSGEFIVMVTDDDPVYPNMLLELIELYYNYPDFGVYSGRGDLLILNIESASTLNKALGVNKYILNKIPENDLLFVEAEDFALKYLGDYFGSTFILWSCCMVKRDIAIKVGGMPDYGSEFLTDHAYVVVCASENGMVFKNTAFGAQEVRGDNFGFEFDKLKTKYITTPSLFYNFMSDHLSSKRNWTKIEAILWIYIGRSWVEYSIMIFKHLKNQNKSTKPFLVVLQEAFNHRKLTIWKYKFYLKAYCNPLFNFLLKLKTIK